jgi:hypothetical protein
VEVVHVTTRGIGLHQGAWQMNREFHVLEINEDGGK